MKCTAKNWPTIVTFFSVKQVMYWEDDTKPDTIGKVRISGNYTLVNITGLKGNTVYYLCVAAFNTGGPGPQSASINTTTKKPRESFADSHLNYVHMVLFMNQVPLSDDVVLSST